jgi:hypothetical protein
MAFDTLAQKYSRPSLIVWSDDEPVAIATALSMLLYVLPVPGGPYKMEFNGIFVIERVFTI